MIISLICVRQKINVNFVLMDFMGFKCEGLIQVSGIMVSFLGRGKIKVKRIVCAHLVGSAQISLLFVYIQIR